MTNSGFWAILLVSQASLAAQYTAPVARTANLEKSHTIDQLECTSSGIYQLKGGAGFPPMIGASLSWVANYHRLLLFSNFFLALYCQRFNPVALGMYQSNNVSNSEVAR